MIKVDGVRAVTVGSSDCGAWKDASATKAITNFEVAVQIADGESGAINAGLKGGVRQARRFGVGLEAAISDCCSNALIQGECACIRIHNGTDGGVGSKTGTGDHVTQIEGLCGWVGDGERGAGDIAREAFNGACGIGFRIRSNLIELIDNGTVEGAKPID